MKKTMMYLNYLIRGKLRLLKIKKIDAIPYMNTIHNKFASKRIEGISEIQGRMAQDIRTGKPFMVGRLGAVELANMRAYEFDDKRILEKDIQQLCDCAGFFPSDIKLLPEFYDEMIAGCRNCDYLAAWFQPFEDYYIKHFFQKNMHMTYLHFIDPFRCPQNPWTAALEGKKVLVVHPQAELIARQYKKRELIFPGTRILPKFDLITLKAVQTNAGENDSRFATWFDALHYMYDKIMQIDYDLAILGCGAYGFPLASMIKDAGKQAVHMGGISQVLFGIRGKRWDEDKNHAFLKQYYNDAWVRVSEKDKPKDAASVENGCYW